MKSRRLFGVRDARLRQEPTPPPQWGEPLLQVRWPDGDLTYSLIRGAGGGGDG